MLGLIPALALVTAITPALLLWSAAILLIAHQAFTLVSYSLGMRATAR